MNKATAVLTLSGGEPLSQKDFAVEFLKRCKDRGYHTAVETCGYLPKSVIEAVLPDIDLFLYDLKHLDDPQHRKFTQVSVEPILRNLRYLAGKGAKVWIRVPVVPTVNDSPEHIQRIGALMRELNLERDFFTALSPTGRGQISSPAHRPTPFPTLLNLRQNICSHWRKSSSSKELMYI